MHLCIQDDENDLKINGLPPAAMARPTPVIITKMYF
jgi:hypothetical protein